MTNSVSSISSPSRSSALSLSGSSPSLLSRNRDHIILPSFNSQNSNPFRRESHSPEPKFSDLRRSYEEDPRLYSVGANDHTSSYFLNDYSFNHSQDISRSSSSNSSTSSSSFQKMSIERQSFTSPFDLPFSSKYFE
jgi:hypothetical protein